MTPHPKSNLVFNTFSMNFEHFHHARFQSPLLPPKQIHQSPADEKQNFTISYIRIT